MSERDFINILSDALKSVFIQKSVKITSEYRVELKNGLTRWIDLFVDSQDSFYIFEVKAFLSLSQIADEYQYLRLIADSVSKPDVPIRIYLVLINETRRSFEKYIEGELARFPSDMTIIFSDDAYSQSLPSIIGQAPAIEVREILAPDVNEKRHSVFISYRRADSAWATGRLADYLKSIYESDDIFLDTGNIDWGDDFIEVIKRRINASNILLAVIGKDWLKIAYEDSGFRRLDDPEDIVRLEIATALRNNLRVIPILIDNTLMPPPHYLPSDLKLLSFKNAGRISANNFHTEIAPLVRQLDKYGVKRST